MQHLSFVKSLVGRDVSRLPQGDYTPEGGISEKVRRLLLGSVSERARLEDLPGFLKPGRSGGKSTLPACQALRRPLDLTIQWERPLTKDLPGFLKPGRSYLYRNLAHG